MPSPKEGLVTLRFQCLISITNKPLGYIPPMKRAITLALILLIIGCTKSKVSKPVIVSPSKPKTIKTDFPTSMKILKNGTLLFTEKDGRLMKVVGAREPVPLLTIKVPKISGYNETGLLGIAVLDSLPDDIFLYHSYEKNNKVFNKVIKYNLKNKKQQIILNNINGNIIHNGGKMTFGPDGMLYIATGDAGNGLDAQNKSSLNGKILRITNKGKAPQDNPFNNEIWSYGHRNIYGLTFDDKNKLFISENGPTGDDEINRIKRGGNYGWPNVTGDEGGRFIKPIKTFKETTVPTGIVFIKSSNKIDKSLLVGSFLDGSVIALDRDGSNFRNIYLKQGSITDLAVSPSNELFISTTNEIRILKLP